MGAHPVLLHGDFHPENTLWDGERFRVIDPKGVLGNPLFDVATYIRNSVSTSKTNQNLGDHFQETIGTIGTLLHTPIKTIAEWTFLGNLLAWI